MHYEPMNGFLFVEEKKPEQSGGQGFVIHGGVNSTVVEATIVAPGDTGLEPGLTVVFRRDVSMDCSLGGKVGLFVNKEHLLAKEKKT